MAYVAQSFARLRELSKKPLIWLLGILGTVIAGGITSVFTDVSKPIFAQISETTCNLMHLSNCSAQPLKKRPFTPVDFTGKGVTFNAANANYQVLVFYRADRQEDAEYIVGALKTAGYKSDGSQSTLDEVLTPDRNQGTTVIKTTARGRLVLDGVRQFIDIARPVAASPLIFPGDAPLQRGDIQIDLF